MPLASQRDADASSSTLNVAGRLKQHPHHSRSARQRSEATTERYLEQLQRAENHYTDRLAALQGIE